MPGKTVLGLDLGPNSIGWALVREADKSIVAAGVRVFPEGVDNFDTSKEISRNEQRRLARGMRRQMARRRRRKNQLRRALVEAGLFPEKRTEQDRLLAIDPYPLRRKAASRRISLHELGRVFYHLNQRRGFLSNRKSDAGSSEVKGMLAEISELAATLNGRTLGEFLADKAESIDHRNRQPDDHVRNRHTRRDMLIDEFERIWETQRTFYPDILTDELKFGTERDQKYPRRPDSKGGKDWAGRYGLFGTIFFQRTMYWPKSMIGLCELEPKEPRCPRADRLAQRFRLLQEVNNLKIIDGKEERRLTESERSLLLDKLSRARDMTFDQIRDALGFLETVKFNLEKGKRTKLWGAPVDKIFASKNLFSADWWKKLDEERNEIVRWMMDAERTDAQVRERAEKDWGFDERQIARLLAIDKDLPNGYLNLSRKALVKLLPHMERGLLYMTNDDTPSALSEAGYLRPDQLQRRIFDKLPDPGRTKDCPIGDIPNPVVKRTLVELRKVVNAIIREYGRPDAVHVEMAREVKQSEEKRKAYNARIREREQERSDAAAKIREQGRKPTRESITRYLLWKEQNHTCVYTGESISVAQLLGGEVDVDHILPFSRSLDDSQMNKVVCFRSVNAEKRNQSPYEWLADSDPARYDAVCQRARKLPYGKYRRFLQKELKLDEFIARQLVDTGYIARATAEYLQCLYGPDERHRGAVLGLKGQYTATLRWHWGLETLLAELSDSPAWQSQDDLRPGQKNRADHRHHALDAIVVALTDRRRLQHLSRIRHEGGTESTGEVLPDPWDGFRDDVKSTLDGMHVSHRVQRKVSGVLHEDTLYGPTDEPEVYVVRKPLASLSPNEVEKIRDLTVRAIVKARLNDFGIDVGRGKKADAKTWKKALADPEHPVTMPSGVPIRRVRVLKPEKSITLLRSAVEGKSYVKPGSNHHLCLFEFDSGDSKRREAVFVTRLEALTRLKNREQIIQRTPPANHPTLPVNARFLFSLSPGELVLMNHDGREDVYLYVTAASTTQQMVFRLYTAAVPSSSTIGKVTKKPNTLDARKVTIDPIGRLRWAND